MYTLFRIVGPVGIGTASAIEQRRLAHIRVELYGVQLLSREWPAQ
jgi:hypothetical protein